MNPDQRESLERKNPHRYGGLGLVSIYVHECQTLLFCVNLYCSKPAFLQMFCPGERKAFLSTAAAQLFRAGLVAYLCVFL